MMKKIFTAILIALVFVTGASAMDFNDIAGLTQSGERVRLGIMKFTSKTYGVPDSMAAGISDFFARMLFKADDIMLVERERLDDIMNELRLGMSGLIDPKSAAQVGKLAGADYMLLGAITNLGYGSSGASLPGFGVPFLGGVGVNTQKVRADLDVRVVKVETGEIVHAEAASGEASKSDTGLSAYGVSLRNSEFGGIEGTAILHATAKLAPGIQKALTGRDTLTSILANELKKSGKKAAKTSNSNTTKNTSTRPKKKVKKEIEADEPQQNAENNAVAVEPSHESNTPEPENEIKVSEQPQISSNSSMVSAANFENHSTDPAKVIATYDLSSGEKNTLRVRHLNLRQYGKKKKAYDEFVKLYEEFNRDYLAAYKAGEVAGALRDYENAKFWYNKALEINPNYEPANNALDKLNKTPKKRKK